MKDQVPKPFRYIRDIDNKHHAIGYNHFAQSIAHIAEYGKKSPICLMVVYQVLPNESHSHFAHQEYSHGDANLRYVQDGFIFEKWRRTAFRLLECIPIYDASILMEWRNNEGYYQDNRAVILPLNVIENLNQLSEFSENETDYIHLGYITQGQKIDRPSIGINGFLRFSITHSLRADARKYFIKGQDSIAFHTTTVTRFVEAISKSNGGHH